MKSHVSCVRPDHAQITFPIAEATSSGLLNLSAQMYVGWALPP